MKLPNWIRRTPKSNVSVKKLKRSRSGSQRKRKRSSYVATSLTSKNFYPAEEFFRPTQKYDLVYKNNETPPVPATPSIYEERHNLISYLPNNTQHSQHQQHNFQQHFERSNLLPYSDLFRSLPANLPFQHNYGSVSSRHQKHSSTSNIATMQVPGHDKHFHRRRSKVKN